MHMSTKFRRLLHPYRRAMTDSKQNKYVYQSLFEDNVKGNSVTQRISSCVGIMQSGRFFAFGPRADKIPNRRKTSRQVTKMERRIKTMMIQVSPIDSPHVSFQVLKNQLQQMKRKVLDRNYSRDILLSAIESDKISAKSKKTLQRSLRTCMRGLISRYSRTA